MTDDRTPLVVDMDGTLFSSDSTELMTGRLRTRRPHRIPGLWRARRRGDKAAMKLFLHRHGAVPIASFTPYAPLTAWLETQRGRRPIYLATGAPQALADAAAQAYGPFDGAFGTEPGHNNTGTRKAARLVQRFGERGFDYAGNSEADLAVWRHARRAIVCNAAPDLADRAAELCELERVL
jgi:phosphoserine phosphatase